MTGAMLRYRSPGSIRRYAMSTRSLSRPITRTGLLLLAALGAALCATARTPPTFVRQPYGVRTVREAGLKPVTDPPGESFDWFRDPRTLVGVYGGPEQALVTPKGAVRNDFGTLVLETGRRKVPMDQRIKTLLAGWLPVVEARFSRQGLDYHVEYFASRIPGLARVPYTIEYGIQKRRLTAPVADMVTFVRVTVENPTDRPRTARLTLVLRHRVLFKKKFQVFTSQPRPATARFSRRVRAWIGRGRLLYSVSAEPTRVGSGREESLSYRWRLPPGARHSLVAKIPYFVEQARDAGRLERASTGFYRARTIRFWQHEIGRATAISVDEPRVVNTYRASLVLLLLDSLHRVDGRDFTHANFDIYDRFFMRDTAFNMKALIDAGFEQVARDSMLDQLPFYQYPDGMFQSQAHEYDGNGEALWMMGEYVRHTHDLAFARRLFPRIRRSMAWQWHFRKAHWASSGGLYPPLEMPDDEEVRGHIVGYDLFAIAGARAADAIACRLGHRRLCRLWRGRTRQYARILRRKIAPAFRALGVVPPTTEGLKARGFVDGWYGPRYGIDWGNLEIVWPSALYSPWSPVVTASLKTWRGRSFEGEMTYPEDGRESILHSYLSLYLLETEIRRSSDWHALEDFYSALVHTTATHMASEGMNAPARWGWTARNLTLPHDEFAAQYVSCLRDMMVFARKGRLYVTNVLSPAWLDRGRTVRFRGGTRFGRLAFQVRRSRRVFAVTITPPDPAAERAIVVHVPANDRIVSVTGVSVWRPDPRRNAVVIEHPGIHLIRLRVGIRRRYPAPPLSFARAVADYELNYRKMWEPMKLLLGGLHLVSRRISAGSRVTAWATLINRGGAGRVLPSIRLWINGVAVAQGPRQLARGIGFNTPRSVISFGHHEEGIVRVSLSARIETPGLYRVTLSLAGQKPLRPEIVRVLPP